MPVTREYKDALGNEVLLGRMYGYSQSNNGITDTVVGKAKKFNNESVSISIIKAMRWGRLDITKERNPIVAVRPYILFPLPHLDEADSSAILSEQERNLRLLM